MKKAKEFILKKNGIAEIIKGSDAKVTIVTNKNPHGMGYGFKKGAEKASKELYMFTGGYNALSEENVTRLIEMADKQDITLAYITNPQIRTKCRRILSDLFTLILNRTTGLNLRYYNAMHIVRTNCLRSITIRSNQQTFIAECVVKLLKFRNCSFREIPVTVNFSQKGNKKSIYRFRKWVINIFDGFRFFYFLFYDITFNKQDEST